MRRFGPTFLKKLAMRQARAIHQGSDNFRRPLHEQTNASDPSRVVRLIDFCQRAERPNCLDLRLPLDLGANRYQPQNGDRDSQELPLGPTGVCHPGMLPVQPGALRDFESLFDPGAPGIPTGIAGAQRQIRQQQPRFEADRPSPRAGSPTPGSGRTSFSGRKALTLPGIHMIV